MFHLSRWLLRYLDDPSLIWWIVKRGGHLHGDFANLIDRQLHECAQLEEKGKTEELAAIRSRSPSAIPRDPMRIVWRLLLSGRAEAQQESFSLYRWRERLGRYGFTPAVRMELRELLAPRITFRPPFRWTGPDRTKEPKRVKDLVEWDLKLSVEHVHSGLRDLSASHAWKAALPDFLEDAQQLLKDALDLMSELGEADEKSDRSHWDMSSISPHWQNRDFADWVALIELVRDAWLAILSRDLPRAKRISEDWISQKYPVFKRLALFAATHPGISDGDWVSWLVSDDGWWLWSVDTQREVMRLLVLGGKLLSEAKRGELEAALLAGPPRRMFRDDIEPDRWTQLVDHTVWLRLAKLASSGGSLGKPAMDRLNGLVASNPKWKLAQNESDEFSHWMSGTGDPDYEDRRQFHKAPWKRSELVDWLQRTPDPNNFFYEDDWGAVCRERFPTALCALCALANQDKWPEERWRTALQVWSDEKLVRRAWKYAAPIVLRMPDAHLLVIASSLSWWLEAAGKDLNTREDVFFAVCNRVLGLPHSKSDDADDDPVSRAINHPIGHATQALLNRWFKGKPGDKQLLPGDVKHVFTRLCDTSNAPYRHARVLLAANVIPLFRVDEAWTREQLLPLFDWQTHRIEAKACWEGFLWAPRLYRPLFQAFKKDFLATAAQYQELGSHARQYAGILTFAALDPGDTFTSEELQTAMSVLPPEALKECSHALVRGLEGSSEQRVAYWSNRVLPYLSSVWPQSRDSSSEAVASDFARLAVAAGDAFPEALAKVSRWLRPLDHVDYVARKVNESQLAAKYPRQVLQLLNALIGDEVQWLSDSVLQALTEIAKADGRLGNDHRYVRIHNLLRRRGEVAPRFRTAA